MSENETPSGDLRASNGELVRIADLRRATLSPEVAGYEGVELANLALAGDVAALDHFHTLVGLALPVAEHGEGHVVRLYRRIDGRAVFLALNEGGHNGTEIDAGELVAWILSAEGRDALARRGIAVPSATTPGSLTPEEAIVAARNVGVDLTCGECAALFYTGHPSSTSGPRAHTCKTERVPRRSTMSCTCGTYLVESGTPPPSCPRCGAPERYPARTTDYVAQPWEELDAPTRMYGVFHAEGTSPDPVAIFRTEESAKRWLDWQGTLGDDSEIGNLDYAIMPVDQLDGVTWNSHKPPPDPA